MIQIDNDIITLTDSDGVSREIGIGTPEAFEVLSDLWLRSGWDTKYVYSFTWMGRPIIQLPEDMLRLQELIYQVRPDVIVETGIAHGGSLVFYASLCKAMTHGRVVGVDLEIRPHNLEAISEHELFEYITMFEGSSTDPSIVDQVVREVGDAGTVMVLLDSCHTYQHVLDELKAYSDLVTPGSYIVAMDGIMKQVAGAPRTEDDWDTNNPISAILEFVEQDDRFEVVEPQFQFNEGTVSKRVTYWPSAFLRRVK